MKFSSGKDKKEDLSSISGIEAIYNRYASRFLGLCKSTWCAFVNTGGNGSCTSYFTFSQNAKTVTFQGYLVSGAPASYTWSFGDDFSGSGQNVSYTYNTFFLLALP